MDLPFALVAAAGADVGGLFSLIFAHEIGRYALGAGGVAAGIALFARGPSAPRRIRQKAPPQGQVRREILASVRTAAIFSAAGVLSALGGEVGITKAYEAPEAFGWPWFMASIVVLILLHDAWFYWTHRLLHRPGLFKKAHGLHHKSNLPTPFTAYSFDVAEACVNAAFLPLVLTALPVAHLAIFIFLAHMILRNAVGHSGYELFPAGQDGRPLFDFLTTVTHHDLHHAQAGWNYGLYFTWWDRWMGTEHPLYLEKFAAAAGRPLGGSAVATIGAVAQMPSRKGPLRQTGRR